MGLLNIQTDVLNVVYELVAVQDRPKQCLVFNFLPGV